LEKLKKICKSLISSRITIFMVVALFMFSLLIHRLFVLQIVKGEDYQENYTMLIERTREVAATRGNIYDRNNVLLAYNELAYSITMVDEGNYSSDVQNKVLNETVAKMIQIIEKNGDSIDNEFHIKFKDGTYSYDIEDTKKLRFLADIFGKKTIDLLKFDDKLGFNQATVSAKKMIDYFAGEHKYEISKKYDEAMRYKIIVVRYALSQNFYRKYIPATVATGVSDETVAAISENSDKLPGVKVEESTIRKYVNSKYFSHLIGYTGKISEDEFSELKKQRNDYKLTDVVGKSGIEKIMETTLQGKKGKENIYVDNLGRVTDIRSHVEADSGNNTYLSIDSDLQMVTYDLLEQEIAGILYSKIQNVKTYTANKEDKIIISIDDVYFALVNNILKLSEFEKPEASEAEKNIYAVFSTKLNENIDWLSQKLFSAQAAKYSELNEEEKSYCDYIYKILVGESILVSDLVDRTDSTYLAWKSEKISLREFLQHAISKNWIDITTLNEQKDGYSDSDEIYQSLITKISDLVKKDTQYHKIIYKYMIEKNEITGKSLCLSLFDQDILAYNESDILSLKNGTISAYDFIKEKIRKLEITPANLALDPCSGSCVITNPQTGELLACVSYPGYDSNKLANGVDAKYFASLNSDQSNPQYNYATQQVTAPGSTFKMVTAAAGLTENVISTSEKIKDLGKFIKIDNEPTCWIYPNGTHGEINISEALRDSCNYFFYEVGYRLATKNGRYNDQYGIERITKYAKEFGFDEKSGIEIPESAPKIATEFPVMAAIGQSNNAFSTIQLSRYITSIANNGKVYNFTLLDKTTTAKDTLVKDYAPVLKKELDFLTPDSWTAIHSGLRMVVEKLGTFNTVVTPVAGKTGTAQEDKTRPSHALFVGYAPLEQPTFSIATRIAFGYTSGNAAEVSALITKYFFKEADRSTLVTGEAGVTAGTTVHD